MNHFVKYLKIAFAGNPDGAASYAGEVAVMSADVSVKDIWQQHPREVYWRARAAARLGRWALWMRARS